MTRLGMLCVAAFLPVAFSVNLSQAQSSAPPQAWQPPQFGVESMAFVYGQAGSAAEAAQIASDRFSLTIIHLRRQFEISPEYQTALQDVSDAFDDLAAAEKPVVEQVQADGHYQEVEAQYLKIQKVIDEGGLSFPDLIDLAWNKMEYGSKLHRMEGDALAHDPAVVEARKHLVTAQRNVNLMRDRFEATLYQNPTWMAAKQAVDNSQIALAGANAAVNGVNYTAYLESGADERHDLYNGEGTVVDDDSYLLAGGVGYGIPAFGGGFGRPYYAGAHFGHRF